MASAGEVGAPWGRWRLAWGPHAVHRAVRGRAVGRGKPSVRKMAQMRANGIEGKKS